MSEFISDFANPLEIVELVLANQSKAERKFDSCREGCKGSISRKQIVCNLPSAREVFSKHYLEQVVEVCGGHNGSSPVGLGLELSQESANQRADLIKRLRLARQLDVQSGAIWNRAVASRASQCFAPECFSVNPPGATAGPLARQCLVRRPAWEIEGATDHEHGRRSRPPVARDGSTSRAAPSTAPASCGFRGGARTLRGRPSTAGLVFRD
jgi:hypothetical protein